MRISGNCRAWRLRITDYGPQIAQQIARRKGETRSPKPATKTRRGVVAVEFAIVAPILMAIMFGLIQMGRAFEMQNLLEVAAREGARFASMDRDGLVDPSESATDKLIADVVNFLASNGIDRDQITVEVKDYENPENDFDIDDPANDLKLFEVRITVDWSEMSLMPVPAGSDHPLTASVTFRNGRATISE